MLVLIIRYSLAASLPTVNFLEKLSLHPNRFALLRVSRLADLAVWRIPVLGAADVFANAFDVFKAALARWNQRVGISTKITADFGFAATVKRA